MRSAITFGDTHSVANFEFESCVSHLVVVVRRDLTVEPSSARKLPGTLRKTFTLG